MSVSKAPLLRRGGGKVAVGSSFPPDRSNANTPDAVLQAMRLLVPWLACLAVLPGCAGRGAHEPMAQMGEIHDPTTAGQLAPVRWSMLEVAPPAGVEFEILRVHPDPGVHYSMQAVVAR